MNAFRLLNIRAASSALRTSRQCKVIPVRAFHQSVPSLAAKVVSTRKLLPESQARLEAQDLDLVQWPEERSMPRDLLLKEIKGAEALICMLSDKIDKEILEAAGPQLKLVTTMSVGFDHIDLETARKNDITIGYTPGVLTDATADLTVLLTLAAARHMKQGIRAAETGEWTEFRPDWLCGYQFTNKTLGVVGMGRIGEAVARRLKAFGINRVLYWGRKEKPALKESLNAEFSTFDNLLAESDYVVTCCSLTPDTKDLFDYNAFSKMKKNAIFVNISRGAVVQQDDLIRALEDNLIAGAGLDVMTPEPLPLDNKLFKLKNCVILPHIGSATIETRETMGQMCVDNVLAALNNKPVPYALK
ncbi:D-isomer specific 2-hydroxyacid dehydrogenase [Radiomyces spectabilis]|uniref:D-isomer specific 2-hydroxyacid dehydrogenase n=1 Tax=Radiomyces spectabilis TaxID=64574 RepID=UPI002220F500|nr:D-isomer specific 2-hydroxyacid dehydrogenase [Radiomyces spectabilis]KAI8388437.1 D-isomer specific 2-hydroxyacid dehydrogenase [Radiomyces spectabilis]